MLEVLSIIEVIRHDSPLKVNPPKMCQLIGGVFATLGITNAIPLIHGSQGCANFVKHLMTKHFKEPIEIATTSIDERSAILGGEGNLIKTIESINSRLNPELIVVLTTCLTETTGENLKVVERFDNVIAVNTPSYAGTHINGYDRTVQAIISGLISYKEVEGLYEDRVNVITGFVNPADVREIKFICNCMGVEYTLLTDLTALDQPVKKRVRIGTDVEDIKNSVNSRATICFGIEGISCAKTLENFGVPFFNIRFPIGIENTDRFVIKLSEITGLEITDEIIDYRGYAIDSIIDAIEVLRGKRVAIFGDPDKVIALTDFAFEIGLRVVAVLSSTKTKHFANEIERIAIGNKTKIAVFEDSDLYQLHKFIKNNPVDVLIGDYKGRYIAVEEKIPLLRIGFPICDRFGYHRKPILGYGGAQRIAEEMANLLVSGCYG